MKRFVLGVLIGILALPIGGYFYLKSGRAPVATTDPDLPLERKIVRIPMKVRILQDMPHTVPIAADEANLAAGAQIYREDCAVCHGLPGQPKTAIAKGMYPPPPQLFVHDVTDDEPGETYWKVANGFRLTGMPGYKSSLSETQMWQVTMMLAKADKLPEAAKAALGAPLSVK